MHMHISITLLVEKMCLSLCIRETGYFLIAVLTTRDKHPLLCAAPSSACRPASFAARHLATLSPRVTLYNPGGGVPGEGVISSEKRPILVSPEVAYSLSPAVYSSRATGKSFCSDSTAASRGATSAAAIHMADVYLIEFFLLLSYFCPLCDCCRHDHAALFCFFFTCIQLCWSAHKNELRVHSTARLEPHAGHGTTGLPAQALFRFLSEPEPVPELAHGTGRETSSGTGSETGRGTECGNGRGTDRETSRGTGRGTVSAAMAATPSPPAKPTQRGALDASFLGGARREGSVSPQEGVSARGGGSRRARSISPLGRAYGKAGDGRRGESVSPQGGVSLRGCGKRGRWGNAEAAGMLSVRAVSAVEMRDGRTVLLCLVSERGLASEVMIFFLVSFYSLDNVELIMNVNTSTNTNKNTNANVPCKQSSLQKKIAYHRRLSSGRLVETRTCAIICTVDECLPKAYTRAGENISSAALSDAHKYLPGTSRGGCWLTCLQVFLCVFVLVDGAVIVLR